MHSSTVYGYQYTYSVMKKISQVRGRVAEYHSFIRHDVHDKITETILSIHDGPGKVALLWMASLERLKVNGVDSFGTWTSGLNREGGLITE